MHVSNAAVFAVPLLALFVACYWKVILLLLLAGVLTVFFCGVLELVTMYRR
jgi:hypothetical protein